MTATVGHKDPSEETAGKGQSKKEKKKQSNPRKQRRRAYQMAAVTVAAETGNLPEPIRSGVVALAQAIIRFFQCA